jgi:uncharacterized membrane protein YcjF (UPF0283 family)
MIEELKAEIEKRRDWHYAGQRQWSFAHHTSTFGASILSLVVAAISQAKDWKAEYFSRDTVMAVLSLVAAMLAALAAKGAFERKWIANRMTRSKLDALHLDLLDEHADAAAVKDALKRIIADHDAAITGAKS